MSNLQYIAKIRKVYGNLLIRKQEKTRNSKNKKLMDSSLKIKLIQQIALIMSSLQYEEGLSIVSEIINPPFE